MAAAKWCFPADCRLAQFSLSFSLALSQNFPSSSCSEFGWLALPGLSGQDGVEAPGGMWRRCVWIADRNEGFWLRLLVVASRDLLVCRDDARACKVVLSQTLCFPWRAEFGTMRLERSLMPNTPQNCELESANNLS